MPDATSPEPLPTRRKRLPLARAVQSLKHRLKLYRTLAVVAVVALVASGAYAVVEATEAPEPVPLGTGRAGVAIVPDSLAAEPPPAEAPVPEAPPPVAEAPSEVRGEVQGETLGGGDASYYGDELAGNPTASGERFDPAKLTAAHRTLPLGSRVRVTNTRNGESVIVRINDRGPFHGQRVIDLSKAAAREIGMLARGTARVRLELLPRL